MRYWQPVNLLERKRYLLMLHRHKAGGVIFFTGPLSASLTEVGVIASGAVRTASIVYQLITPKSDNFGDTRLAAPTSCSTLRRDILHSSSETLDELRYDLLVMVASEAASLNLWGKTQTPSYGSGNAAVHHLTDDSLAGRNFTIDVRITRRSQVFVRG